VLLKNQPDLVEVLRAHAVKACRTLAGALGKVASCIDLTRNACRESGLVRTWR